MTYPKASKEKATTTSQIRSITPSAKKKLNP